MTNPTATTETKRLDEIEVGDVVLSIATTEFTEPHTVTRVVAYNGKPAMIYATGGCLWPVSHIGAHHPVKVAR